MITLLLLIISSTLSYKCWIEYAGLPTATEIDANSTTIEPHTTYTKEFNACESSMGGMYEIKYEFGSTNITSIDMYYEILNNNTYIFEDSVCNGTCTTGNKYVCCTGNYHDKIRVVVETRDTEDTLNLVSLSVHSTKEWAFIASCVGFAIICIVLCLMYIGFMGGCVCCIIWRRSLRRIS